MKEYSFIHPDYSLQNNLMAFGYDCGEGWYPLIEELFDKIQSIVDAEPDKYDFEVTQVKEKWGSLTIYLSSYYPEIEKLIDEYQEKSTHICEQCGKPGKLRESKCWILTLCDECDNKDKNK